MPVFPHPSPETFSQFLPAMPGPGHPFNHYGEVLRNLFRRRVQKLSLNTGNGCPNRDGSPGSGCHWCLPSSFQPAYCHEGKDIETQFEEGRAFFMRKGGPGGFLPFLQGYTTTLGDSGEILGLITRLLDSGDVPGVVLASRPDTLEDSLVEGLSVLARNHFICIELGIESFNDRTLADMNRGHSAGQAIDAVMRLRGTGIFVGAHMILGLPGDTRETQLDFARVLSGLPIQFLKLHHLQVLKGTMLARRLEAGEVGILGQLHGPGEYQELCAEFLENLKPGLVIDRFTNEAPPDSVIAPLWGGMKNQEFARKLYDSMKKQGRYQGARSG